MLFFRHSAHMRYMKFRDIKLSTASYGNKQRLQTKFTVKHDLMHNARMCLIKVNSKYTRLTRVIRSTKFKLIAEELTSEWRVL